ncbi:MAG: LysM peptidoglycan-binding domain-containing protein [Pseudomonadota bacterium]
MSRRDVTMITIAVLFLIGFGIAGWFLSGDDPSEDVAATPPSPSSSEDPELSDAIAAAQEQIGAATEALGGSDVEPASGDATEEEPATPSFDVVRVSPDGMGVLAGRAEPNSTVLLTIDGDTTEVTANASGEFVATIDAPFAGDTRTIELSQVGETGEEVKAEAPVIIARPTEEGGEVVAFVPKPKGVEVLQPPSPRTEGEVSIDALSYADEGDVVVAGRGEPGTSARIYLDNELQAEAEVDEQGEWTANIAQDAPPAVYTLRVDQVESPTGAVTSRAETPFERALPSDIVLADGDVVVQPGNNLWRIASFVYGDGLRYHTIYSANQSQIRDPDLIYPGQIIQLPN